MPTVLFTPEELLHAEAEHTETLKAAGFDVVYPKNSQFTRGNCGEEESVDELSVADAVIAGSEHITASMLERLPRLRVIARSGVGYDRVDVPAATSKGIVVTITPTAVHEAAAEHSLALLLAVSKQIVVRDSATRNGGWPRDLVEPVRRKTLGILGLGRIGRTMAIRSAALGMKIIACDVAADESFASANQIQLVDFDTLIEQCDVLSIHCPVTDVTRGIINADVLQRMKPTAIIINTARGAVINESDLVTALREGSIKGAGLDVYDVEPPDRDNPLFQLGNVVVSPHAASGDWLAMQDMATEAANCIVRLHQGNWPANAVINNQLRETWSW